MQQYFYLYILYQSERLQLIILIHVELIIHLIDILLWINYLI